MRTCYLYSVIGTYITHIVGRKLVKINFIQQKYEADFRFSMIRLRESAESVAFYRGEAQEGSVFKQRFKTLLDNFWKYNGIIYHDGLRYTVTNGVAKYM